MRASRRCPAPLFLKLHFKAIGRNSARTLINQQVWTGSYPRFNKPGFLQLRLLQHFLHLLDLQHVRSSDAVKHSNVVLEQLCISAQLTSYCKKH